MKKGNQILSIILIFNLIISCNSKKETLYVQTELPNGYTIKLPSDFSEIREGVWQASERSYLEINLENGKSQDLKSEFENFLSSLDSDELQKDKKLVRTETFNENGLEGIISYYKKDIKGKGVGLVTLTSYIIIATVQDNNNLFYINSITLSDNNFDEISKAVKSISLVPKLKDISAAIEFDTNKAREDGYQIFKEDGFMIKCNGVLKLDNLRIQQMKQSGLNDNSRPFHVYSEGVDYNINVSDFENILIGQSEREIFEFNKNDLDYYQTKFDEMSVKNSRGKFKDYDAVYYENTQNGRTTKAVFFHYKMKSYMIQVTDENEVENKFQDFIKTFKII